MRHAILGAGGIGGFIGAALARSGQEVVLLMRPSSLARYDGRLTVESAVLGDFAVQVPAVSRLEQECDVLWVATKAMALGSALAELGPPDELVTVAVIPLLNGVDHMAVLRERYRNVVAAAMRVESERAPDGSIRQLSPFARIELAGCEPVAAELESAGLETRVVQNELALLWNKLAFLAPVALATTALDATFGAVRDDGRYLGCQEEALAVADAVGARVDVDALRALQQTVPDTMRSSMQKDVAAGRIPELDAIAGPILRGGKRHGIAVPHTDELSRLVAARAAQTQTAT